MLVLAKSLLSNYRFVVSLSPSLFRNFLIENREIVERKKFN